MAAYGKCQTQRRNANEQYTSIIFFELQIFFFCMYATTLALTNSLYVALANSLQYFNDGPIFCAFFSGNFSMGPVDYGPSHYNIVVVIVVVNVRLVASGKIFGIIIVIMITSYKQCCVSYICRFLSMWVNISSDVDMNNEHNMCVLCGRRKDTTQKWFCYTT